MAKCSKENCERDARKGQRYCGPCHAAAQTQYREHSERKRDKANYHYGFQEGVKACVSYLRTKFGERAFTGFQFAHMIEKNVSGAETGEQMLRRRLLAAMGVSPERQEE